MKLLSTIEQKVQDDIVVAKANNAQATINQHTGHPTSIRRWDSNNLVKVCNQCKCSILLIESKAPEVEQVGVYIHYRPQEERYKVIR